MSKRIPASNILLKRAYAQATPQDGVRVLIDRLWPRGVTKKAARINHWFKELAPSAGLRKWFDHDPMRWLSFRRRYSIEIRADSEPLKALRRLARKGRITLVYAARDETHNDAVVLRDILLGRLSHKRGAAGARGTGFISDKSI
jgi:uncharacterized protein YeaO (DUF488 family)